MDVETRTPVVVNEVWQQQKENEAGFKMMNINQELMDSYQDLNIQMEKRERESTAQIEVCYSNLIMMMIMMMKKIDDDIHMQNPQCSRAKLTSYRKLQNSV